MLGGRQVTRFKRDGEQYDVIVQVADAGRTNPDDIRDIYVRGRDGSMIPLDNLIGVSETVAPRELNHFGQRRAVTITANLAPGYTMGEALSFMDGVADAVLKPGYAVDYNGQSREFRQSSSSLALTFVLALAFIYLVLAAQFESFRDPFIIMLTVPLSMTGALLALLADRRHAQRLQPDRAGDAGRPDHQARHPDRRVRQPVAGEGPATSRRR